MIPTPSSQPTPAPTKFSVAALLLATLIAAATAGAIWWLRTGQTPPALAKWVAFLGETHPLMVHFPVGWIIGIFTLGFLHEERHHHAIRTLLWLNLLTCAAALVAGQADALDRAQGVVLTRHFYAALAVGVFSWLALLAHLARRPQGGSPWLYRVMIFGAVLAVTLAGHFGATLSHGELLDKFPWVQPTAAASQVVASAVPAAERTVLEAVILPVLQARCMTCHGPEKQKGNLRLDSYLAMMATGESEKPSFIIANPAESESLRRCKLPLDDEDHMPPDKKPQIEPAELAVLEWWVLAGADPKLKLVEAPAPDPIKAHLQALAAHPPQAAAP